MLLKMKKKIHMVIKQNMKRHTKKPLTNQSNIMKKELNESSFSLPKLEQSEIVFDEFVKIQKDRLINSEGHRYQYYTLIVPSAAALVLAQTPDKHFVLIKEYRHPTKQTLLSLPGGYIDEGESPLEAAERELQEEAGYSAAHFELLGCSYPYPGISGQAIYYVFAQDAYPVNSHSREPCEHIDTILLTDADFKDLLSQGHPVDGNLLTAFFWLNLKIN